MSSPALPPLRPPAGTVIRTAGARVAPARPVPETARPVSPSAGLRTGCGREGPARARAFTPDTLCARPPGDRRADATLLITELIADAVTHTAPRRAGAPDVRPRSCREPTHPLPSATDSDDHPPVRTPGAGSGPAEHGRGPRIVDAPAEGRGKTVWVQLSTRPPI
ncbi:ATP-binding protein [Streptomyces sp. NRRL WC-3626]|uniref:ATP-binding protein n=1 Tax=Streptomyces sp. NRRL WC-3626 TaxID=1463926 RepID=UPI001F37BE41|nr:ATP-binding protein [Streptomyces sp. NRRL WC-3626]